MPKEDRRQKESHLPEEVDPVAFWVQTSKLADRKAKLFEEGEETDDEEDDGVKTFAQLSMANRNAYLRSLTSAWPYKAEKYAFKFGNAISCIPPPLSVVFLLVKYRKTMGLSAVMRLAPFFAAGVFGHLFPLGITIYVTMEVVQRGMLDPVSCTPCLAMKQTLCNIVCGVVFPLVITPLSMMSMVKRHSHALPRSVKELDYITMRKRYVRPIMKKYALPLVAGHVLTAWIGVYSKVWAIDRILPTLYSDPELLQDMKETETVVEKAERHSTNLLNRTAGFFGFGSSKRFR